MGKFDKGEKLKLASIRLFEAMPRRHIVIKKKKINFLNV